MTTLFVIFHTIPWKLFIAYGTASMISDISCNRFFFQSLKTKRKDDLCSPDDVLQFWKQLITIQVINKEKKVKIPRVGHG